MSEVFGAALFRARAEDGFSPEVRSWPGCQQARTRPCMVQVRFATLDCLLPSGAVPQTARAGDALVTATSGDTWPVPRQRFLASYQPCPPLPAGADGSYLRLPGEVLAVCMTVPFDIEPADTGPRLHGSAGDWLVDGGDGNLSVVGPAVFEASYELLSGA